MQMHNWVNAGALKQVVLVGRRHQYLTFGVLLQQRERTVTGMGLARGNAETAFPVPLPDQFLVFFKPLAARQVFAVVTPPPPPCPRKVGTPESRSLQPQSAPISGYIHAPPQPREQPTMLGPAEQKVEQGCLHDLSLGESSHYESMPEDAATTDCDNLASFIAACHDRSLTEAIVAWRHEWGPRQLADGAVEYGPQATCWLLAYDKGHMLRCTCETTRREQAVEALEAGGLTVSCRRAN